MIKLDNVSLSFASQTVFDNISLTIDTGKKIGLVGNNGAGKSTLLNVLARNQSVDSGTIVIAGKQSLAYLPQELALTSELTTLNETASTTAAIRQLKQQEQLVEQQLAVAPQNHQLLAQQAEVQANLCELAFEEKRVEAEQLLTGLGFTAKMLQQPVSELSGGWRMRVVLAKLLLQKADFYLFDEPTNHLDLLTKQWFLAYLQQASFGYLLVCHDKYFLNKACQQTIALERGVGKLYHGNYDFYRQEKATHDQQHTAAYQRQQRQIQEKLASANKFRAKATKAKMAQRLLREVATMEKLEAPSHAETTIAVPPIRIQQPHRIVVTVNNVRHQFPGMEAPLFEQVHFQLERGQKVAIVAPNGGGKTTLFNLLTGSLALQQGRIEWGDRVRYTIFEQEQNKVLNPKATIFEEVNKACTHKTDQEVRNMLEAFLFSGNDVDKKTGVLSGGEKNRVCMVRVLLQEANVLLLDEPTNHLDIPSKEVLLHALQAYPGTILFVSHDQEFVDQLATHIIALTPHGAGLHHGTYSEYIAQNSNAQQDAPPKKLQSAYTKKEHLTIQRELIQLERKIEKIEKEKDKIEATFASLSYGTEAFTIQQKRLARVTSELAQLTKQWEALQEKADSY